jgi:hypothetical protein
MCRLWGNGNWDAPASDRSDVRMWVVLGDCGGLGWAGANGLGGSCVRGGVIGWNLEGLSVVLDGDVVWYRRTYVHLRRDMILRLVHLAYIL